MDHFLPVVDIRRPNSFFQLAIEATSITDPYVPERMFAAAYGATLAIWSDINAVEMRESLPHVARDIYSNMFAPDAANPTRHALYQQYCLGIIAIARILDSTCLTDDEAAHLLPPFNHLPNPFENMPQFDPLLIKQARDEAVRMDFGNYTVGRLIPGRRNYDDGNKEYQQILQAIVSRMLILGYTPEHFEPVDRKMYSGSRMGDDKDKVDRYGKKYSWIAYFEMWGVRFAQGLLDDRHNARPSDADIDPTFPPEADNINLPLPDLFSNQPIDARDWIVKGPKPDYYNILEIEEIDGFQGQWVLLDGFIEHNAPRDDRQVFTFLRGLFVETQEVENLCNLFKNMEYPGNSAIPETPSYHYTYAGEMPFTSIPGSHSLEDEETDHYEYTVSADMWSDNGIPVDITMQNYSWESYHSVMNQSGNSYLPSKQLCKELELRYRANTWDLQDVVGTASLYRKVGEYGSENSGFISYLRRDLLDRYLLESGKTLVWLIWGERGFHYRAGNTDKLHEYYAKHQHIHKSAYIYVSASDS
ncbi:hypothetical protein [Lelliottia wanjuensis]|uniref:Uncharacterized protein n=1 Tax=Lelliottia wanjuensis TaxID=3050585 RepID=A0AAP4D0T9_9ENTR|nr:MULTISPECIES: hypothetical protein [unclassified Lelliottia]MDK9362922.1 hypothetical protein [Lelliottia sp. V106_12]MDK9616593.1 hypothetical protein [Lelliottia sp. V106_9]